MLLHLRLSPHALKKFTDNADATDFIFSQILFLLVLPVDIGFTTDCFCAYTALDYLQQEIIRENPSARQAQTNHNWIKKSVKRTDPSHRRYPWLILNVASETKASEHIKGVLSSRQLSLTFLIPETSSRVTLAALGIGFQPNLARHLAYQDDIKYQCLMMLFSGFVV